MYNTVVYPYDDTINSIVMNINKDIFSLKGIISPKGWGYCGDVVVNNREKLVVMDSINKVESDFDSICIVNSYFDLSFEQYFIPLLQECKRKKLHVFWFRKYTVEELQIIKSYIGPEKLHIMCCERELEEYEETLYEINVPIVFIVDTLAFMKSLDVQLQMYFELKKQGYKVKLLSPQNNVLLINGVDVIPTFMFDSKSDNKKKIIGFNQYIKCMENDADIILVGIPGNAIEISREVLGDFAYFYYLISKSVTPDYVVCNLPFSENVIEKYKNLGKYMEKILNINIDTYVVLQQYFDLLDSESLGMMSYTNIPVQYISRSIKGKENLYCLCDSKMIANNIINKLVGYARDNAMNK